MQKRKIQLLKLFCKHIKLILIIASLAIISCNPTKDLGEDQYLLVRNEMKIEGKKTKDLTRDDLTQFIEQNPNTKFLGIVRLKMWLYKWAANGKNTGFNQWIKEKLGEPPAIFNRQMARSSVNQMQGYLNNSGFFDHSVHYKHKILKRKKSIEADYIVNPGNPYLINEISYNIPDTILADTLFNHYKNRLVQKNQIFNAYTLENERDKITNILRNHGYYAFSKEYIFYEADTGIGNYKLNLALNIKNKISSVNAKNNDIAEHEQYFFNKIYIDTDYNPLLSDQLNKDTINIKTPQYKDTSNKNDYFFIYTNRLKIKPKALTQAVFINSDKPFNLNDIQQTYKRLTEIRLFNYANIQFKLDTNKSGLKKNYLNCQILLSRAKTQSFTIEAEGTNTGGNLGVGGNIVYQNKNIFKGAELLTLKLKAAMEVQKLNNVEGADYDPNFLFFNTLEMGSEISLYFPRFMVPLNKSFFSKDFKPKTTINAGLNYQRRPKYTRYISNLSFGYDWVSSPKIKHLFFPFDFNIVKVLPTPEFDSILNNLTDMRLVNQYSDHLIPGLKYSFIFNNQDINKLRNFTYFRLNIETSGNLLNLADHIIQAPRNKNENYTLFSIRYAQFVKLDFDYRYYIILDQYNRIALRGIAGIGIPYGNSEELPFEKGFYAGGSNGIRAWRFRTLGPGSYKSNDGDFDRMGDIKIEANAEYRFPIYRFLKGAFFADAGNIWLLEEDENFPGGKFQLNNFFDKLAMDLGLGIRFDFGFFLFRIDGAIPVRDPTMPSGNRWVFNKIRWKRLIWNFGIGYPF